jgi:hypothetical protein
MPKSFGVSTDDSPDVVQVVADEVRVEPQGGKDANTTYVFYIGGKGIAAYPVARTKWVKAMSADDIKAANEKQAQGYRDLMKK